MIPASLTAASFVHYPAEARVLAERHLTVLRSIPLAVLPSFLEQVRSYGWRFPQEQLELTAQLDWLERVSAEERGRLFTPFTRIVLASELEEWDWVGDPQGFIQMLSAYLWRSSQVDSYRAAVVELFRSFPATPEPPQPALVVAVIGRDAPISSYPLFMRMRAQGLYARNVSSTENARDALLAILAKRARAAPVPYSHWYIDGGDAWALGADEHELITHFTYPQLAPINEAVLKAMDEAVQEGTGPEVLSSRLSHLGPAALGAPRTTADPRLQHLYVSLLTVGSGTQLYSTSFLQAAAIEVLRRAQPATLYFRFAPRRRQASINDLIEERSVSPQQDPEGSLIDGDMAAYYVYLQLAKLPGGARASFVIWVEGRGEAFVISPNVPKGVESSTPLSMQQLLSLSLS